MEKRTLLAFALSFLILLVWSFWFGPKQEQGPPKKESPKETATKEAPEPAAKAPIIAAPQRTEETIEKPGPAVQEKEIKVETDLYRAIFTNLGPTIKSLKLKKYRQTTDPNSPLIELVDIPKETGDFLSVNFLNPTGNQEQRLVYQVDREAINLGSASSPEDLVFSAINPDGLAIRQTYRFYPEDYRIELRIDVANKTGASVTRDFVAALKALPPSQKKGYYSYVGLVLLLDDKLKEIEIKKVSDEKTMEGRIGWVAYEDDYFISAIMPEGSEEGVFKGRLYPSGVLEGSYRAPAVTLQPSEETSSRFALFFGPRELDILKNFGGHLDRAINFGWTDIIAKPLLYVLRFFYKFVHNYGVAIILLTILVKILFWPLTHKSYKSMKEMQKLQPRMAKIREKYKDNKEQMNKEMMALYKTYKVNPMSGCLPMIIQIPVFFALFRILGSAIELRHAPFMLWINDLAAPDRLFNFSFQIPFMKPPYGIPVLTLLMGVSMFVQQKMTPTPGDPAQAKIMMFLPVVFTFLFINFPSGLVLYWLVNNVLSIGQQYRIQKSSV